MSFQTSRNIPAPPPAVFAAFENRDLLAAWWGPDGFTNTFETFEFRPGGRWKFVMHGPDGKSYPNETVVTEVEAPKRIVLHHISQPRYILTVTLEPSPDGGTRVDWDQEFENPETGRKLEKIVVPANEQNLDRLSALVCKA